MCSSTKANWIIRIRSLNSISQNKFTFAGSKVLDECPEYVTVSHCDTHCVFTNSFRI